MIYPILSDAKYEVFMNGKMSVYKILMQQLKRPNQRKVAKLQEWILLLKTKEKLDLAMFHCCLLLGAMKIFQSSWQFSKFKI